MSDQHDRRPAPPIPVTNSDNAGFWEACRRHELCIQRCTKCGKLRHHPRPMCPACNSLEYDWQRVSGRGTLYSFTIVHRPTLPAFEVRVPYNVAIVRLEEGPYLVTNIVDCPVDRLHIGMPVAVTFDDVDETTTLPKFRPVRSD